MGKLAEVLRDLFQAHGVEATLHEQWVDFPSRDMRISASILQEITQPASTTIELEVRLEFARGRTIIEAFAGLGATTNAAVISALENFVANSFHVLLDAFFLNRVSRSGEPGEDGQASQQEWLLGGQQRRVTVGNVGVRGKKPVQGPQFLARYEEFEKRLRRQVFDQRTHWVRLYYAQRQGKVVALEVLLDNQAWEVMEAEMAALAWPLGEHFYSVRVFLVIEGEDGHFEAAKPASEPAFSSPRPKGEITVVPARSPWWRFRKR